MHLSRDLVFLGLAQKVLPRLVMLVKELLQANSENVFTVLADDSIREVARLLACRPVGIVIVIGDKRRVEGVLSERSG